MNVVKFPYSASRRVFSQKPRRSKNGTPEERAAKAAAATPTAVATVTKISSRSGDNRRPAKAAKDGTSIVEFLQSLRALFIQEFARGKDIDQIFGELEESYSRLEVALARLEERRASENSDFQVNLPDNR